MAMLFTSGVVPARSAPIQQPDQPVFRMSLLARGLSTKNYLCINETTTIVVEIFEPATLESQTGFPITALATGKRGILTPNKPVWPGVRSKIPGTAEFVYKAKTVGAEKIFFEAIVPDWMSLTGTTGDHVEGSLEFEVKRCKYKVIVNHDALIGAPIPPFSFEQQELAWIDGAIIEQDASGMYHGSADLVWNEFTSAPIKASIGDTGPQINVCTWDPVTALSPAEITGRASGDTLSLTITYTEVSYVKSMKCILVGTQSVDQDLVIQPTLAVIPTSGGAFEYEYDLALGYGTWLISAYPQE